MNENVTLVHTPVDFSQYDNQQWNHIVVYLAYMNDWCFFKFRFFIQIAFFTLRNIENDASESTN